jgi:beta-mannanase
MRNLLKQAAVVLLSVLASRATQAQTQYKTLNYLYGIAGQRTVSGMHNRQPISAPATYTNRVNDVAGDFPALWSSDFLFEQSDISSRGTMINEAKSQWAQGAIINLMFHACPPTTSEPCQWEGNIKSSLTNAQWQDLITDGGQLNRNWKARLDAIVPYLQDLKNNGVEVLFRPLHEMNQGIFWWAGRPGPQGTARLYQITHDYLKNTKGLTNLIWVWDLQDFSSLSSDLTNYNPGSAYWDVLALDMYYSDGQGYTTAKYNAMLNAAGGKPIAIGECEVLPSSSLLSAQPLWAFFMGWSELVFQKNSNATIQNTLWAGNVVVRDEMPGWANVSTASPNLAYQRPVTVTSTYTSANAAAKAVDADGNTRWESAYANNQSIFVDLGRSYNLSRVRLAWEAAYAKDYQLQVSSDGSTWTTIKDVWGKSSATADDWTSLSASGRYVKVYCINRATTYGFSLYELEVYGTTSGSRLAATTLASTGATPPDAEALTVYPNPASSTVRVRLGTNWHNAHLILFDNLGRQVYAAPVTQAEQVVNLANLPTGLYRLLVADATHQATKAVVRE